MMQPFYYHVFVTLTSSHISSHILGQLLLIIMIFEKYGEHTFWSHLILSIKIKFVKYFNEMPLVFSYIDALIPTLGAEGVENLLIHIATLLGVDPDHRYSTFSVCLNL